MRPLKETESKEATPEQLLQILDDQLAARRSQRTHASRNRAIILVMGLLFIVVVTVGALLLLDQMLGDLRQNGPPSRTQAAPDRANF